MARGIQSNRRPAAIAAIAAIRAYSRSRLAKLKALSFGTSKAPSSGKVYIYAGDSDKERINRHFSAEVASFLGKKAKVAILDSKHLVTSRCLTRHGIPRQNIWAPNEGRDDVHALCRFGVHSVQESFENFLSRQQGLNAMWYDSMTTIGGNAKKGHYIGTAVHRFLRQNQKPGQKCVVAVTVTSRNRCPESIHGTTESTVRRQISTLAMALGFEIISTMYCTYRSGKQQFGLWTLTYGASVIVEPSALLTWQNDPHRYVSFPINYKFMNPCKTSNEDHSMGKN